MTRVHVIGAGLAGLSAALALVDAGRQVTLYEAGPAAGGRCRSYFDRELGCRIDNGNHLWMTGNHGIAGYLARIGAADTVAGPAAAEFPFIDLATGERWSVRPNAGLLPWWVLSPRRSVPGARLSEYAGLLKLLRAGADATVAQTVGHGTLVTRMLEPLTVAALNTSLDEGSAQLIGAVIRETLGRGGQAFIPRYPKAGMSETFIDPALDTLRAAGAELRLGCRVTSVGVDAGRVTALHTADGEIATAGDAIVVATPGPVAAQLVPGTTAPDRFEAIVNIHYRADAIGDSQVVAVLGGTAQWVFVKPGVISVTVSAANALVDVPSSDIAATVWPEVCAALALSQPLPPWRVLKEKRATFAATPAQNRLRPAARTRFGNLVLAGDWTATGLPATIEGAIRSGRTAAGLLIADA